MYLLNLNISIYILTSINLNFKIVKLLGTKFKAAFFPFNLKTVSLGLILFGALNEFSSIKFSVVNTISAPLEFTFFPDKFIQQ